MGDNSVGTDTCTQKLHRRRKALLNLETYLASEGSRQHHFPTFDYILHTWTNDTTSDCCRFLFLQSVLLGLNLCFFIGKLMSV